MEEWRAIPGFPDYSVSSLGRVRRETGARGLARAGMILKSHISKHNGYAFVGLWNGKRQVTRTVHPLVCRAFHGPPPTPRHETAHGDNCRSNNEAGNLRWATRKENHADKLIHGTAQRGEANGHAKHTDDEIRTIRRRKAEGESYGALARAFETSKSLIWQICKRRCWAHLE